MSRKSAMVKLRPEKALSSVRFEKFLSAIRVAAVSIVGGLIGIGLSPTAVMGESCWPAFDALIGNPGMGTDTKPVLALAHYDDGNGEGLYAAGFIRIAGGTQVNKIARWNGDSTWSDVGGGVTGGDIYALAEFQGELYAGGNFSNAGGRSASNIARWDGQTWKTVGTGTDGEVDVLYSWIDPENNDAPALYAGGTFTTAGGLQVNNLAKWNGSSWSDVDGGVTCLGNCTKRVNALVAINFGGGAALYVGGKFTRAGGTPVTVSNLAKWDGTTWADVGNGADGAIAALGVFNNGQGQELYVGGDFGFVSSNPFIAAKRIARWNGSTWSAVGGGVERNNPQFASFVTSFTVAYDGIGCHSELFVGGLFDKAGGALSSNVARWDGTSWLPIIENGQNGIGGGTVDALHTWATGPGNGDEVYLGGAFSSAAGFASWRIARRSCQTCKWDIDNDGQINPVDSGIVQTNFGCLVGSGGNCDRSDVDRDCMVNAVDLGLVQAKFGVCP